MKCLVRYNAPERSWDCPCHGSRFDVKGRPLEGPTMSGLERVRVDGIDDAVAESADDPRVP
jgi:Rieske Fe-S protein